MLPKLPDFYPLVCAGRKRRALDPWVINNTFFKDSLGPVGPGTFKIIFFDPTKRDERRG